jgi:hypothetical protein
MSPDRVKPQFLLCATLAAALGLLSARQASAASNDREDSCSANHNRDRANYAETREERVAAASLNYIHPGQNGSIHVQGWSNGDVLVKACIQTSAPTDAEARELASEVKIANGPGNIEPSGPANEQDRYWNVSYDVWVPAVSNLKLQASNGSIGVEGVRGQMRAETLNGSVHLREVAGDVEVSTTNGSVALDLTNASTGGWSSSGIKLSTTNGSVRLIVPRDFSARVEASTVNGSIHTDFPITVSGEIGKHMSFTLGSGGPLVEAKTVNGSVRISSGA